jgi:hypothetical protein
MKRNREDDDDDDAMDVQDAHCAVEEQRRLFEESFKKRRMQEATLPNNEIEAPLQPPCVPSSSKTVQMCSEELTRLLNDLEADPETRENSQQLLEHVILEREKANKEVSDFILFLTTFNLWKEPALSTEFVSLWAAGSIWMTRNLLRKRQESLSFPNSSVIRGNAFPLSRIAGLLTK